MINIPKLRVGQHVRDSYATTNIIYIVRSIDKSQCVLDMIYPTQKNTWVEIPIEDAIPLSDEESFLYRMEE